MIKEELITDLFLYYSRFVSNDIIEKRAVQPRKSEGYDELIAEAVNHPDKRIIDEVKNFFFSINEKYVSDAIKNAEGYLLFVEYGRCLAVQNSAKLVSTEIELAVTVAHEFTIANKDMIEEVLIMQKTLSILRHILDTLNNERKDPNYCPNINHLVYPCQIVPVEPASFFDHGGWSAIFTREDS